MGKGLLIAGYAWIGLGVVLLYFRAASDAGYRRTLITLLGVTEQVKDDGFTNRALN